MKKNKGFLGGLQKSTQVTLLSCISFIALTLLILIFFILFPITPSEKIMASIGRENVNNTQNITPAVVTTAETTPETVSTDVIEEETGTRTTKTYKIVITTGSGFLWNGRIPAGISDTKTTVVIADDPKYPTADPGYVYPISTQPPAEEPNYPVETNPVDPYEPPVTDDTPVQTEPPAPVTDIPVWTEPPAPVTADIPVWTEPPIIIDPQPPVDVPVTPPEQNYGEEETFGEW